jgi:hypothetical protein
VVPLGDGLVGAGSNKVNQYGRMPGEVVTHGNADASVLHLGDGLGGAGHIDLMGWLSRSSGEEIPQTI